MAINKNEFKLKSRAEARKTKLEIYTPRSFRSENQPQHSPKNSGRWFTWLIVFGMAYAAFKYLHI